MVVEVALGVDGVGVAGAVHVVLEEEVLEGDGVLLLERHHHLVAEPEEDELRDTGDRDQPPQSRQRRETDPKRSPERSGEGKCQHPELRVPREPRASSLRPTSPRFPQKRCSVGTHTCQKP